MARIKTRALALVDTPRPVITPAAKAEQWLAMTTLQLDDDIRHARTAIDSWANRLTDDPANAFAWSSEAFEQAAKLKVASTLVAYLGGCSNSLADEYGPPSARQVITTLRSALHDEVMGKARYPARSSSSQSNEMSYCLMAAWANWLERFDRFLAVDGARS